MAAPAHHLVTDRLADSPADGLTDPPTHGRPLGAGRRL